VGIWEKPRARYADEVKEAIARATREATRRRHHDVGTTHLLWSLLGCASVEACLGKMSVDPSAARAAIAAELDAMPRSGWMTFRRPKRTFDERLVIALRIAADTPDRSLTAPLLVGRLVSGKAGDARAATLARAGFARLDYLRVVAHGDPEPPAVPSEGVVTVALLDDPFTTMEHVVETLREVFGIASDAERIMLRIHHKGRGVVATMDAATARQKIAEVHARAGAACMPLRAVADSAAGSAAVGMSAVE
jgi:ATP-dependent Clp protease adaptor protein ClpS